MNGINKQFSSINQVADQFLKTNNNKNTTTGNEKAPSFQRILEQTKEIKFSKHASGRLSERSIELTDAQKQRLEDGMMKAKEKGINESLVIVDELAFIVNVPNNTVITAINQNEANENVFTNIDGAVII